MVLNIAVDLLLAAGMLTGAVIGVKNGFIKASSKPLRVILTLYCTLSLAAPVSSAVVKPVVRDSVCGGLSSYLIEHTDEISGAGEKELPTVLKLAAGLTGEGIEDIAEGADGDALVERLVGKLTDPLVSLISFGLSLIALYLLFKAAFSLAVSLLDGIFKGGVLGVANRLLGGIFTSGVAFAILWAAVALLEFFLRRSLVFEGTAFVGFEGGAIYRFFKSFDPLEVIFSF